MIEWTKITVRNALKDECIVEWTKITVRNALKDECMVKWTKIIVTKPFLGTSFYSKHYCVKKNVF